MVMAQALCWLLGLLLFGMLAGLPRPSPVHAQQPSSPELVVDTPTDDASVPARLTLVGWAVAAEHAGGPGVDRVEAYLDGPRGTGALLGTAVYGLDRPDVALARRDPALAASGWMLDVSLPPGARTLYLYAHRQGDADEEGWSGPVVLHLRVEGQTPAVPTSGGAPASAMAPAAPAPSARPGACQVTDRDSGRCLVRSRNPSPENPTNHVLPGSWSAMGLSGAPIAGGDAPVQGEVSALASGLAGTRFTYGVPLDFGLASRGGGPGAAASASSGAMPNYVPAAISLTATPLGRGQFALAWNPLGSAQLYEVRRCTSYSSPTTTCAVVALVQSGSYQLAAGDGVYLVRAVGAQGQPQGESNRVLLCCRS
jgi:hypothetical protein